MINITKPIFKAISFWVDNLNPSKLLKIKESIVDRAESVNRYSHRMRVWILNDHLKDHFHTEHSIYQTPTIITAKEWDWAEKSWAEAHSISSIDGASASTILGDAVVESYAIGGVSSSLVENPEIHGNIRIKNANNFPDDIDFDIRIDLDNSMRSEEKEENIKAGFLRHFENTFVARNKAEFTIGHGWPVVNLFDASDDAILHERLDTLESILQSKKAAFQASATLEAYRKVGSGLQGREYLLICDTSWYWHQILSSHTFNENIELRIKDLASKFAADWVIGAYRAGIGRAPNIFLCHVDNFTKYAALLCVDAFRSGEYRNFPLSIDLADRRSKELVSPHHNNLSNQVQHWYRLGGGDPYQLERISRYQ